MATIQDNVNPGDVISSDLINRIIAMLNAHEALIINSGPVSGSAVTIGNLIPPPPLQAGQEMEITGTNFGFTSGATVVKFDSTQVNAFRLGSNDTSLKINVPFLPNLGTGKDVVLSVSNATTTAARVVRVNPMQQQQQGNVDVLWNDTIVPNPSPNPVANGQPLVIAYILRSRALLPSTFTISVQCSNAAMQTAAQVLDAAQAVIANKQIELAPGQQKGFFIRFPDVPVANNGTFTVTIGANTPGVAGSDTRNFTVNAAVATQDPTIGLTFNALTATDPNTGNPDPSASFSATDNTLRLRQGTIGRVNLFATFTQIGTYDVTVAPVAPTANWTVALAATPSQYVIDAGDFGGNSASASRNPEIGIQAQAGSSATGQIRFTLQRQGSTQKPEFIINLARIP